MTFQSFLSSPLRIITFVIGVLYLFILLSCNDDGSQEADATIPGCGIANLQDIEGLVKLPRHVLVSKS